MITNLKPEARDDVYLFLYPEENESDSYSSTSDEEEFEDE